MARRPRASLELIGDALPDFDAAPAKSLQQQWIEDPIAGTPMMVQLHPGAEATPVEPGQWLNMGLAEYGTGLPPCCPVIPLGKDGSIVYLLDTLGAVAQLDAKSSGKGPIGFIFGGRSKYLEWAWPRFGRASAKGKPPVTGWDADNARQSLVDACSFVGYFALEDQVRGRGAWQDDDGSLIYHAGDEIFIGGKWRACGVHGDHIYPARPKLGRPTRRAHPPGPGSAGDTLLELLRTFNFERTELDARLVLGWLMTAKMGGALDRRPVLFVVGSEGSGKSTLHALLRQVMNRALIASSNTTQAGIYQQLQQDSIAIMVDELEAKEDTRTVDKILELARICYSGDKLDRGGKEGVGNRYTLRSSFMGSTIAKPATDAQDDSRMALVMLRKRAEAGGKLPADGPELDEIGRQLLRRIFDGWARWPALLAAFRSMMIAAGHTDRACDTFAPLAAASHLALSDDPPSDGELAEWAAWLDPRTLTETATREETWQRCWWQLMEAHPRALEQKNRKSVGQAIEAWRNDREELVSCEACLAAVGMALSWPKGADPVFELARLFVPLKSPPLHDLFAGTPWPGRMGAPGPWGGVLKQMPQELWKVQACDKGLNRQAKGLMIDLAAVLASFEEDKT